MVTAYGDDEHRRRATNLGATEFPRKPLDFDALRGQLRQLFTATVQGQLWAGVRSLADTRADGGVAPIPAIGVHGTNEAGRPFVDRRRRPFFNGVRHVTRRFYGAA